MTGEELPKARVRRRRLFTLAWIIPLIAAAVAGYLVWDRMKERGPEITITFTDGGGLRQGVTPVKYRGVIIGEVTHVGISEDHKHAVVRARLQRSAASIARDGAIFWIVRPQFGFGNVTGLNTVLTGPEIHVLPGKNDAPTRAGFAGLDAAPVGLESVGLKIILRAERPRSIKPNTPVSYRGVEVGLVQKIDLGPNSLSADVHVLINGARHDVLPPRPPIGRSNGRRHTASRTATAKVSGVRCRPDRPKPRPGPRVPDGPARNPHLHRAPPAGPVSDGGTWRMRTRRSGTRRPGSAAGHAGSRFGRH